MLAAGADVVMGTVGWAGAGADCGSLAGDGLETGAEGWLGAAAAAGVLASEPYMATTNVSGPVPW